MWLGMGSAGSVLVKAPPTSKITHRKPANRTDRAGGNDKRLAPIRMGPSLVGAPGGCVSCIAAAASLEISPPTRRFTHPRAVPAILVSNTLSAGDADAMYG